MSSISSMLSPLHVCKRLMSPLVKTSLGSAITLAVSVAVAPFFKSPECIRPPLAYKTIPATGLFSWFKSPEVIKFQPPDECNDVEPPLTTVVPAVLLTAAAIYIATRVLLNHCYKSNPPAPPSEAPPTSLAAHRDSGASVAPYRSFSTRDGASTLPGGGSASSPSSFLGVGSGSDAFTSSLYTPPVPISVIGSGSAVPPSGPSSVPALSQPVLEPTPPATPFSVPASSFPVLEPTPPATPFSVPASSFPVLEPASPATAPSKISTAIDFLATHPVPESSGE